jgi:hypothetical protein
MLAEEKQWKESEIANYLKNPFYVNPDFFDYMSKNDPETLKALKEIAATKIGKILGSIPRPFSIDNVPTEQPSWLDDFARFFYGNPVEANPKAIGRPGFWGSMVPVVGHLRTAINAFQNGGNGEGFLNLGLAALDATGIVAIAKLGAKAIVGAGTKLTGFSNAEEQIVQNGLKALKEAGYDISPLKELIRADLPPGYRAMSLDGGAALGNEALSSQAAVNSALEEELLHLQQKAAGLAQSFGPGTTQPLEEAVDAARKFPVPKQ